jgi:hypothetical protein
MSDTTNVAELRPSPAKGEAPTRNALRQRRYRAKRKSQRRTRITPKSEIPQKDQLVSRDATKDTVTRNAAVDAFAYTAAIGLASVAALFSIKGMVQLFPGTPLLIIAMATMMESAKLVTAGWLASRWRTTAWIWRLTLVALIAGLAVINGVGVFSQLVASHVGDRGAAQSAIETQDAALAAKISVQSHTIADLDRRLGQIDSAIEEAAKRGKTNTALSAIEGQRKARQALVDERKREADNLAALQAERASVVARRHQIETETAPIRFVAELVGADTDSERAIRLLILLIVLTCDPLAIALTAAASARR